VDHTNSNRDDHRVKMKDTRPLLIDVQTDFPSITRNPFDILQVNLGYTCNLSCTHCHVNAGPKRTEQMDKETVELVLDVLEGQGAHTLDLTGGAPELNQHFRFLVKEARSLGVKVIDRCNLTILNEPGQEDLAEFLANNKVDVCASLPCYSDQRVDAQRGKGTFDRSIMGLGSLNDLGYGKIGSGLLLDLVYNPQGPSLPPSQEALELDYKTELQKNFGIVFNRLLTITNMPIQRFGAVLLSQGHFHDYMSLLKDSFSADNLPGLMCRNTVSVDWQGYLYDCDFNQMLKIDLGSSLNKGLNQEAIVDGSQSRKRNFRPHLSDLLNTSLRGEAISVAEHCFACTAGQGSSCGGALES